MIIIPNFVILKNVGCYTWSLIYWC